MEDELKLVFTGSEIEAAFIEELLQENGIGAINRNLLNESIMAGWASGGPEDACELYVEAELAIKAEKIISDYLSSR